MCEEIIKCCACSINWEDRDICEVHGIGKEREEENFEPSADFCLIHEIVETEEHKEYEQ